MNLKSKEHAFFFLFLFWTCIKIDHSELLEWKVLGQNSHFSSKSMKIYYKKSHTVESQLSWKAYPGCGSSVLFMCCQFALEVKDELWCLAKQLNSSLGQMESRSHPMDWFGAEILQLPFSSMQSFSELEIREQSGSCAALAGLSLCLCIVCSSSGKSSSFRNFALQLHRDGPGTCQYTKTSCIIYLLLFPVTLDLSFSFSSPGLKGTCWYIHEFNTYWSW